jgi:apolipoprotein N-acyltransferase
MRRLFAGDVSEAGDALVLRRADVRVEVPFESIQRLAPWRWPLPGRGFSLRLRSGRVLGYVVECADLAAAVDRLSLRPAVVDDGALAYARAKEAGGGGFWQRPWVKYVLFALPLAAIFFNAHQHIAYGGTLGQYYLEGLAAWLQTFGVYWATMSMYLLLYASVWRGLAEAVALSTAFVAPPRAAAVRRAVEFACLVLFYGGVPALTALRFVP